jgi:hypothetical protein
MAASAYQSLHRTAAQKLHVSLFQGALPHAVFEEAATLAVEINAEVAWLAHRAAERVSPTVRQVEDKFLAQATMNRA